MSLPYSLYSAAQVRELDRIAIEEHQIPGIQLMHQAGQAAWQVLQSNWSDARNICVVCGAGNNAGDGYILAKLAFEKHFNINLLTLSAPEKLHGDAKKSYQAVSEMGIPCQAFDPRSLSAAEVIVDAILGTGIDRDVGGGYAEAIAAINSSGRPVLSIDIPSGLNADTGKVMGQAIKAQITVTFIGLKTGLFTGQGPEYCGQVVFSDLDVPEAIYEQVPSTKERIELEGLPVVSLPRRRRDAHKGDYGHVLIIGGDYGFAGAARMASEAAARTGAGLVTLATRPEHAIAVSMAVPEIMARGVDNIRDLEPMLERATVIAIGPGLGQSDWAMALLSRVLDTGQPVVVDADALNLIAGEPSSSERWVLTPHPGEAARLLNTGAGEIQADRFAAVQALQAKYGGVIVLKGSGTLVADSGRIAVCSAGNPGMATGGMGDILTGMIAALIAQGLESNDAAKLAVCLHAAAADEVATEQGERGMLATDLLPRIRHLLNA